MKIVSPNVLVHYDPSRPISWQLMHQPMEWVQLFRKSWMMALSDQSLSPQEHSTPVSETTPKWKKKRYHWCLESASFMHTCYMAGSSL
jgi:hypothetical protein